VNAELRAQLAEELNVESVTGLGEGGGTEELVHVSAKANFRSLGRRFGRDTPRVAAAITAADPVALASALRTAGQAGVEMEGETVTVGPDDVIITETPREGWAVATDTGETLALDLQLTPALVRRGLAREVIRLVQEGRKAAGLQISDRIELWLSAQSPELAQTLEEHGADICVEVLAVSLDLGAPPGDAFTGEDADLGLRFGLRTADPAG
jgi:isoleucyl-tRNA synthetase